MKKNTRLFKLKMAAWRPPGCMGGPALAQPTINNVYPNGTNMPASDSTGAGNSHRFYCVQVQ